MGMRMELYCLDSAGSFPECLAGDWRILPGLMIDLLFPAKGGLAAESIARLELLASCLAVGDQLYEYLEELVAAGKVDAREVENIDVSCHVVELVYKHPRVCWITLPEGLQGLAELQEILTNAALFHGLFLAEPSFSIRHWLGDGGRGTPDNLLASERELMQDALDELNDLRTAVEEAKVKGFARMFLYYQ